MAVLSSFTGIQPYLIAERSEATPGLFNNLVSVVSQNLDQLNSDTFSLSAAAPPGALNAASLPGSGITQLQAAFNKAAALGIPIVYIPTNLLPYNASLLSFYYTQQLVREGGDWSNYDVRAYGASGNNVADDTTAFAAAINSAGAQSRQGEVFVPAGDYIVSSVLLKSYVHMCGVGWTNSRIIQKSNSTTPLVSLSSVGVQYIALSDLWLDGNKGSQVSANDGISFLNVGGGPFQNNDSSPVLHNILVSDSKGSGVVLDSGVRGAVLLHVVVLRSDRDGFYIGATDSRLVSCVAGASGYAGYVCGGNQTAYIGCKAFGSGSTATTLGNGYFVTGGRQALIGCEAQENADDGFEVNGGPNTLAGCYSDSNSNAGIRVFGSGASGTVISGGHITDTAGLAYAHTVGLSLDNGAAPTIVAGLYIAAGSVARFDGTAALHNLAILRDSSGGGALNNARTLRVLSPTGTEPGLSFSSEVSLGWHRSAASTMALSYGTLTTPGPIQAGGLLSTTVGGLSVTGSPSGYAGDEVRLATTASGVESAIASQAIGSPPMSFDHRGASNTGFWRWRNGTGASSVQALLTGGGQLQLVGVLTVPAATALSPSIAISSETSLGLYRSGVSTLAFSYGTLNLATQGVRLSMRTIAASALTASAANTNVAIDETVFTIQASGASFVINSGGTSWIFNSVASAKNT